MKSHDNPSRKEQPFTRANSFAILTMTKTATTTTSAAHPSLLCLPLVTTSVFLSPIIIPSSTLTYKRNTRAHVHARTHIQADRYTTISRNPCRQRILQVRKLYLPEYNSGKERLPWIIQRGMDIFHRNVILICPLLCEVARRQWWRLC